MASQHSFAQDTTQYSCLVTPQQLPIHEVIKSGDFKEIDQSYLNLGYFEQQAWIKFSFNSDQSRHWILSYQQIYIDSLEVFVVANDSVVYQSGLTGASFLKAGTARYYKFNGYIFPFELESGEYQVYINLKSRFSPLRAKLELLPEVDFKNKVLRPSETEPYWFFMFGLIALAAFIGVMFFVFTRNIVHLLYGLFMIVNVLNLAASRSIIGSLMPWFQFTDYDARAILNGFLMVVTSAYFSVLVPKKYSNRFVLKGLQSIVVVGSVILMLAIVLPQTVRLYHILIFVFKPIFFVSFFLPVVHFVFAIRNGHGLSKFFLFGYSGAVISSLYHILQTLGIIDFWVGSYWDWEMSMFLELIVFSIAFAYEYHMNSKNRIELAEQINKERSSYLEKYYLLQEEERKRIATDLHDGVIQQLVSLNFSIDAIPSENKEDMLEILEDATSQLRDLSHTLMPKSLVKLGLERAVGGLLTTAYQHTSITCNYEHFGIENRLPQAVELNLYRIIQELINNVIKHSRATAVEVQLYQLQEDLHLIFEDNGDGFDTSKSQNGIGLQSIRSRVEITGGSIYIEIKPTGGMLTVIKVPLL